MADRLAELQQLHASGLISDADFEAKKAEFCRAFKVAINGGIGAGDTAARPIVAN